MDHRIGYSSYSPLGALYAWRRREHPPRVVIQEIKRTELLDIHPSQRDSLTVIYQDEDGATAIENLEQKDIVIYNSGTKDITEPLQLKVEFRRSDSAEEGFDGFWRWVFDEPDCDWSPIEGAADPQDDDKSLIQGVQLKLPYLNSYPVHRHFFKAFLVSDGEIALRLLERTGKGWLARFISLHRARALTGRATIIAMSFLLSLTILSGGLAILLVLLVGRRVRSSLISFAVVILTLALLLILLLRLSARRISGALVSRYLRIRPPSEFK